MLFMFSEAIQNMLVKCFTRRFYDVSVLVVLSVRYVYVYTFMRFMYQRMFYDMDIFLETISYI